MARTQADFAGALAPLASAFDRLRALSKAGPGQGSRAYRDGRTRLGRLAWLLAVPAAVVGLDHLAAWQGLQLRAGLQPSFAHFSLIRGAAEGCAVARWLCDPAIDAGERLARAAGAQIDDYAERIKFERRLGPSAPKPRGRGRTGTQRLEELERELRRVGVRPIALPPTTDLFARYFFPTDDRLGGEALYRQISGVVHAKVWSMFALSELGQIVDQENTIRAVAVQASEETAFVATLLAMRLGETAVADVERYAAAK